MQNYNCIIGVIRLRLKGVPYKAVQQRYSIGSNAVTLIMKRFRSLHMSIDELSAKSPEEVVNLIYPQENVRRKDIPMPDFQAVYDRIMAKGSKVNISYCWIDYKEANPDGYESTQYYEYYRRFLKEKYGVEKVSMAVERIPGEKVYIDWVGDKPEILLDAETGELQEVCVFITVVGISDYIYAEIFENEKLPHFIEGTADALRFYGAVPKYLVPDNCKTAVKHHSKDELVLNASYQDLENFYDTIILPPPPRKPKGKPTVENHVRFLETHLIEKLKERGPYTSLAAINEECQKIVTVLNNRQFEKKKVTRKQLFEKYDKPHMKPLPGGKYISCEYKAVTRVPDNYHIEFDGHYYSVLYTQHGKPAILKASLSEIKICDENNRLLCTHRREYRKWPIYITDPEHMPPEHRYYKEVNAKNGSYYRNWAKAFGPYMEQLIDAVLRSSEFEEQSYNSCSGILHACDNYPRSFGEAAAEHCVRMQSMRYSAFKKALHKITQENGPSETVGHMPESSNLRGRDHWS